MKRLFKLQNKKKKLVIGLMSGTSVDGIDAALVEIQNSGSKTKIKQLYFATYAYPEGLKEFILTNSIKETSNVEDICRLNFLIGKLFAKAAYRLCKDYGISIKDVDLIGSHGQTIHHLPQKKNLFGEEVNATLQIGDPSVISKLTGVVTVGDFRIGDMALGGEGAPLVPYFDFLMFRSNRINRCLLNIGGISNITFLPKKCKVDDVIAFDTGPGNILIDLLMQRYYNKKFDEDGKIAFTGKINEELHQKIINHDKFINLNPPKSTGREYYNQKFIDSILETHIPISPQDIIATFSNYTAFVSFYNYKKFLEKKAKISELIVSGGGANNEFILNALKKYFEPEIKVKKLENANFTSDAKEAVCFAVYANETISEKPINIPAVTGANQKTILGKICL